MDSRRCANRRVYRGRLDLDQVHVREDSAVAGLSLQDSPGGRLASRSPSRSRLRPLRLTMRNTKKTGTRKQSRLLAGLKPRYQNGVSNWILYTDNATDGWKPTPDF